MPCQEIQNYTSALVLDLKCSFVLKQNLYKLLCNFVLKTTFVMQTTLCVCVCVFVCVTFAFGKSTNRTPQLDCKSMALLLFVYFFSSAFDHLQLLLRKVHIPKDDNTVWSSSVNPISYQEYRRTTDGQHSTQCARQTAISNQLSRYSF